MPPIQVSSQFEANSIIRAIVAGFSFDFLVVLHPSKDLFPDQGSMM
jgi:hypothetical protein